MKLKSGTNSVIKYLLIYIYMYLQPVPCILYTKKYMKCLSTKYSKVVQGVNFERVIHFHLCVWENPVCLQKFMQPFADSLKVILN